jgi:hypothetical protein
MLEAKDREMITPSLSIIRIGQDAMLREATLDYPLPFQLPTRAEHVAKTEELSGGCTPPRKSSYRTMWNACHRLAGVQPRLREYLAAWGCAKIHYSR